MVPVTDAKSLYDAVQAMNPTVDDKRTLLDILSLSSTVGASGLRWVPGSLMWADGLTKRGDKALRARFSAWLQSPTVRLRD